MAPRSPTPRSRSGRNILASHGIVFGMHSSAGRWPGKKPLGDKERAEPKRKASLRLRERYRRRGKDFGYIDERGFAPAVTRRYASAPTGRRVYGLCSGHRRPRTSLLAARIGSPLATPLLFDGTCNTTLFNAWLTQELCPLLHDTHVGVLDHVPFHQSATTKELIMTTGATLLFLPPYSPDLNPLEHDFAAIKKLREYNE